MTYQRHLPDDPQEAADHALTILEGRCAWVAEGWSDTDKDRLMARKYIEVLIEEGVLHTGRCYTEYDVAMAAG